jgi:hypothetical protein
MFTNKRKARLEIIKSATGSIGIGKFARGLLHDLSHRDSDDQDPVTVHTASMNAIHTVREVMANYTWTAQPKYRIGTKNVHVRHGQKELNDGVINVIGELRTPTSVRVTFDVPVQIHEGKMLEPSVMFIEGTPHIISQSAISNLIGNSTSFGIVAEKPTYSGRFAEKPRHQERKFNGLFSTASAKQALRDMIHTHGTKVACTDADDGDREVNEKLSVGSDVTLSKVVQLKTRGGGTVEIKKGTSGKVIRDMDGAGRELAIRLEDGKTIVVNTKFLKQGAGPVVPPPPVDVDMGDATPDETPVSGKTPGDTSTRSTFVDVKKKVSTPDRKKFLNKLHNTTMSDMASTFISDIDLLSYATSRMSKILLPKLVELKREALNDETFTEEKFVGELKNFILSHKNSKSDISDALAVSEKSGDEIKFMFLDEVIRNESKHGYNADSATKNKNVDDLREILDIVSKVLHPGGAKAFESSHVYNAIMSYAYTKYKSAMSKEYDTDKGFTPIDTRSVTRPLRFVIDGVRTVAEELQEKAITEKSTEHVHDITKMKELIQALAPYKHSGTPGKVHDVVDLAKNISDQPDGLMSGTTMGTQNTPSNKKIKGVPDGQLKQPGVSVVPGDLMGGPKNTGANIPNWEAPLTNFTVTPETKESKFNRVYTAQSKPDGKPQASYRIYSYTNNLFNTVKHSNVELPVLKEIANALLYAKKYFMTQKEPITVPQDELASDVYTKLEEAKSKIDESVPVYDDLDTLSRAIASIEGTEDDGTEKLKLYKAALRKQGEHILVQYENIVPSGIGSTLGKYSKEKDREVRVRFYAFQDLNVGGNKVVTPLGYEFSSVEKAAGACLNAYREEANKVHADTMAQNRSKNDIIKERKNEGARERMKQEEAERNRTGPSAVDVLRRNRKGNLQSTYKTIVASAIKEMTKKITDDNVKDIASAHDGDEDAINAAKAAQGAEKAGL